MPRGRVSQWKPDRGVGRIIPAGGGPPVFLGDRSLRGLDRSEMRDGLEVEYDVGTDREGRPRAENVRRPGTLADGLVPAAADRRRAPQARNGAAPLPERTWKVIASVPISNQHPGLLLDKHSGLSGDLSQAVQKTHLEKVVQACAFAEPFMTEWLPRRRESLPQDSFRFRAKTRWRLTLHLARAGVLENAGLALHPIYGFCYLPGTGIKGIARAYAETVWLRESPDAEAERSARVTRLLGSRKTDDPDAGDVVFYEAWPTAWPKLEVDIVNNHHREYYEPDGAAPPPGDWESPVPVYFLAVAPETEFEFVLSKRDPGLSHDDLALAQSWLEGALTDLGAGAKTAAGYGYFDVPGRVLPGPLPRFDAAPERAATTPRGAPASPARAPLVTQDEVVPETARRLADRLEACRKGQNLDKGVLKQILVEATKAGGEAANFVGKKARKLLENDPKLMKELKKDARFSKLLDS